jgi:transcriptional regulator with XRE-family HTH domain
MLQNKLKEIRLNKGLRQCDVAEAMGFISPDRISHWETGTAYPSIQNLFKLATMYGVSVEELYYLDTNEKAT